MLKIFLGVLSIITWIAIIYLIIRILIEIFKIKTTAEIIPETLKILKANFKNIVAIVLGIIILTLLYAYIPL
jgi:hypothetical protein